jgi:hypothetical protein
MTNPIAVAKQIQKQIKSRWGEAGLTGPPQPEEARANVLRKRSLRSPKHGGVMISVRVTPAEKRKLETIAFDQDISLGEVLARLLALYEEKHGPVVRAGERQKG